MRWSAAGWRPCRLAACWLACVLDCNTGRCRGCRELNQIEVAIVQGQISTMAQPAGSSYHMYAMHHDGWFAGTQQPNLDNSIWAFPQLMHGSKVIIAIVITGKLTTIEQRHFDVQHPRRCKAARRFSNLQGSPNMLRHYLKRAPASSI